MVSSWSYEGLTSTGAVYMTCRGQPKRSLDCPLTACQVTAITATSVPSHLDTAKVVITLRQSLRTTVRRDMDRAATLNAPAFRPSSIQKAIERMTESVTAIDDQMGIPAVLTVPRTVGQALGLTNCETALPAP